MQAILVPIELTASDIEKFKLFQKHYELFLIMEERGVFNIQFGKCILNIANGDVQTITKEEGIYKR